MESKLLSINELKDAFFSVKLNKSPGYNDTNVNVIKKYFGNLCEPFRYLRYFTHQLLKVFFLML